MQFNQEILECINKIKNYSNELYNAHNYDDRWYSLLRYISEFNLKKIPDECRAAMIAYFTRLTTLDVKLEQEQSYRQLMIEIVKLIELLNDSE